MPLEITRDHVLAFRLRRQHLDRRLGGASLAAAVAACGIRNTPPGSAQTALAARVYGLSAETVPAALADKSLVEVLGPRLTPTLVLPPDVPVFTVGAMPADDASLEDVVGEIPTKALAADGISLPEAVRQVSDAAREVLAGGPLTRGGLSAALTRRLPDSMSAWCQRCGSRHVWESLFRIPGGTGVFCFAPRSGREVSFVRMEDWLGSPAPDPEDADAARLDLVRRFLSCHGPATPGDFAGWTNTGPGEARRRWADLKDELDEVTWDGRAGSVLAEDVPRLRRLAPPDGVRLLPPGDPYLLSRDRSTLVPDAGHRKVLWPPLGAPGALLVDGEVTGIWRAQRKWSTLRVQVLAFALLPATTSSAVQIEAELLASLRNCRAADVLIE